MVFNPEQFAWTNSDGNPRTLGQFFTIWKKCVNKCMVSTEFEAEGTNMEVILDKLFAMLSTGDLAKPTSYIQVRLAN